WREPARAHRSQGGWRGLVARGAGKSRRRCQGRADPGQSRRCLCRRHPWPEQGLTVDRRRLQAVFRKELRQLSRDRLTFAMIIGIPILQLLLFGFAINLDIRNLPAAVLDESGTWRSRELVAELASSQVLDFRHRASSPQQIDSLLRSGEIGAAVVIPADFEKRLERGNQPAWQLMVDGSDQSVQAAARQLASFPLSSLQY